MTATVIVFNYIGLRLTRKFWTTTLSNQLGSALVCVVLGLLFGAAKNLSACEDPLGYSGTLPTAPSSLLSSGDDHSRVPGTNAPDVAKKYHRIVKAGQQALPLSVKDKLVLSIVDRASVSSLASSAFTSGIGYWSGDVPHYGVNLPAYGQRFGAAYLKGTTETLFSYGIYASLFHDDPRYYVMGSREKVVKRAIYAASRVVITRKDEGDSAINWPKLGGITTAAALTNTYYPERDRRFGRTATSVLSTIATTAAINEVHEFIGDAMRLLFRKHQDDEQTATLPNQ